MKEAKYCNNRLININPSRKEEGKGVRDNMEKEVQEGGGKKEYK